MVEENSTSGGASSLANVENWEKIKSWVGFWVEGVLIPILCVFGILGKQLYASVYIWPHRQRLFANASKIVMHLKNSAHPNKKLA